MAKPLGPKSLLIRDAIKNNPDLGNTEIAQLINGSDERKKDKIEVKPGDIAAQRQAMKKGGSAAAPAPQAASKSAGNGRRKGGRRRKAAAKPQAAAPVAQAASGNLLDAARQVKELCERYGAETVKGLAELFGK